jgi:hypothetical protein
MKEYREFMFGKASQSVEVTQQETKNIQPKDWVKFQEFIDKDKS